LFLEDPFVCVACPHHLLQQVFLWDSHLVGLGR
jgi:hypothetical protein